VAVYHVVTRYDGDVGSAGPSQEELLFELAEPPGEHAPDALALAVVMEVSPFLSQEPDGRRPALGFPPKRKLPAVRRSGRLLWSRDPSAPSPTPVAVELVHDAPEVPDGLVNALRARLADAPEAERASLARERLVVDGSETWSRINLHVEALFDEASRDASRRLSAALRSELRTYFPGYGLSIWPTPEAADYGIVVHARGRAR